MADIENNDFHTEGEEVEVDLKEQKTGDWEADVEDFVAQLAPEVRRRILALKKLQLQVTKYEAQFYAEVHALEVKYAPLYKPIFEKRSQITNGAYEPTDEECDFPLDESEEVAAKIEQMRLEKEKEKDGNQPSEKVSGIPDFWLKIFRNVEMLEEITEEPDVPILKHLTDITVEVTTEPMGFKLHFHFSPNEYFKDSVLTKTYEMKSEVDPEDPFSFDGPEIFKCTGCHIDWYPGKDVTVKEVKKKQKHKQRGSVRTVTKKIEAPSFFNFFNPPSLPESEMDEEIQIRLTNDFELGQYIRERIIPRAVLFYTGEALEEEEEEEEYDEEEDEDEADEEEDEEEEKEQGKRSNRTRKTPSASAGKKENPQDCKQQ